MKIKKSKILVNLHKSANVTRKTNMHELLMARPELAGLFFQSGMGCAGCSMSMGETLEQGCMVHGMSNKEIDKFVERLNKDGEKKKKIRGKKRK